MILRVLAILCALLAAPVSAQESIWIETEGFATVNASGDTDSARRRALADALLNAALAGGAYVQGHSVMSMAVVERDMLIVRPTGQVMRHQIIETDLNGNMWTVRIRALVGPGGLTQCDAPQRMNIITYAPDVRVSPYAPAWTEVIAQDTVQTLYGVLDRHPHVANLRITERPIPNNMSDERAARDYVTLTSGDVRLGYGDYGFVPRIVVDTVQDGRTTSARLILDLSLFTTEGVANRQEVIREVRLPGPSLLGNAASLTNRTRNQMMADLRSGLDQAFDRLLSVQSCTPLAATVAQNGNTLSVQVGHRHGLTRGAIAYTADSNATVDMLEVVSISNRSATLRPLDPTQPISAFDNRAVRFIVGQL